MGLNVVVLGPPGAGKGTQATRFSRQRGLPKISTGDILRQGLKEQLPAALMAKARMDRGELVDDETMLTIVRERLARPDTDAGFVLDGFPRTVSQARALDVIVEERGKDPLFIVDIEVPEKDLVTRLAGRRICSKCGTNTEPGTAEGTTCRSCGGTLVHRADDSEQVVVERLKVYARATWPLVEFYRERPMFRSVNGAQSSDRVARELDALIDSAVAQGARAVLEARGAAGR